MAGNMKVFVAVPKECMGIVIGSNGRNINKIKQETHTKIQSYNGDHLGRGSGFTVTGSNDNVEAARKAIQNRVDSATVKKSEPVLQQFVGLLIRRGGSDNFRRIEQECNVKITWPKFSGKEKHVIFDINGPPMNCERALEMLRTNIEKWKKRKALEKTVSPVASASRNNSKFSEEYAVPAIYVGSILGARHKNKENIETRSRTIIKLPRQDVKGETENQPEEVILTIIGRAQLDIVRAKSLILSRIISLKDHMRAEELGGYRQFVCLDFVDESQDFQLEQGGSGPRLNAFLRGQRYRLIESEKEDVDDENDVADKTISELKEHLSISLQNLHDLKDEKELMVDLWCHFGKVFVDNVDEDKARGNFTPEDVYERVQKTISPSKTTDKSAFWKISFEEGIDPSDVGEGVFPEAEDMGEFDLKLVHTQWRYDYAFTTASARNVRLKVWEGLPPGSNEPPIEVKNILTQVLIQGEENIKAWLCYPSTTVLKGEIMTPHSQYDCRMKLRAGSRYVIDKDSVCEEEDMVLRDYLSNCKFDEVNHRIDLPDEREIPTPKGFDCTFYREAKERIFSATVDGNFTVVFLDENGWDSDASDKRIHKQFGIRVMMNSWSDALLSPARNWTTEEILDKLRDYMVSLSVLKNHFFKR